MKYKTKRAHELLIEHGYRIGTVHCVCGYKGGSYETLDEILLDFRGHARAV